MTTMTTRRSSTLPGVVLVALSAFAVARAAPHEVTTVPPASATVPKQSVELRIMQPKSTAKHGFYEAYLTPRMLALFPGENAVNGADFANLAPNPMSNQLRRDSATADHAETRAIRAIEGAFKSYAVESLGIDRWSFPVVGARGRSPAAPGADSRGARLHFGFSHLAPRADLLIPVTAGRVVVSADVRGRIGMTFAPTSSKLRLAMDVDVPEHTATVLLNLRF